MKYKPELHAVHAVDGIYFMLFIFITGLVIVIVIHVSRKPKMILKCSVIENIIINKTLQLCFLQV